VRALVVSSVTLTLLAAAELVLVVGPAAVALLAEPLALAVVTGLVVLALTQLPRALAPRRRSGGWRMDEPSWPAWCAGWSVGRAPVLVAIHGRDGPVGRTTRP
jgi:hypothetical protein